MPEEHQPMPPILPLLGDLEAQAVDVEVECGLEVLYEQVDWSNLGDGEGPGEHHPFYVILGGKVRLVSKARVDVDALVDGILHFRLLRHLGDGGLLGESAVVHLLWLAASQ